jgi:2-keto-4-pentenoate hydratase
MTPVSYIPTTTLRLSRRERMTPTSTSPTAPARAIAERLVAARRSASPLAQFPGPIPGDLDTAYAIQGAGISLWPDSVAGWKVGWLAPQWQEKFGEERLVGPIFGASIRSAPGGKLLEFPVFEGGFAAVEGEFIFRLMSDAPPAKKHWTAEEAGRLDLAMLVGIETAGSPLASINDLGPGVIVSDFGNNAGLILGPEVFAWRNRANDSLACEVWIEGRSVGRGGASSLPGGPLAGLAFALARCAQLARPLKAGELISTGATTGIHEIRVGQSARVRFGADGEIHCRAVRAGRARHNPAGKATASC